MRYIQTTWELHKPFEFSCPSSKDKVSAFIQARLTSTRFPGKIYEQLNGAPLLYHTISRAGEAGIKTIIVCSPHKLPAIPEKVGEYIYTDENDVLGRYYWCLKDNPCDYVVRLTSDCPVLDPGLIRFIVYQAVNASADYCSNVLTRTFPDGQDVEVIKANLLRFLHTSVEAPYHREHVTTLLRDNQDLQEQFNCISIVNDVDYSGIKISVDTPTDLEYVRLLESQR